MKVEKIHTCTGHKAAIYTLAPGSDERHFLSAAGDGWVVEWNLDDPETGQLVASVETQVFSLCTCAPRRLVAGNMNGGVHWIDRDHPDQTRNIQHHQKGVFDILSTGTGVFTAGGEGSISRWDMESGRSVESFQLSNQSLRAIAFSRAKNELAVGGSDCSIYLLDAETLALKQVLKNAHANSVFSLAYSPDQEYLLSGGRDALLKVWESDAPVSSEYRLFEGTPAFPAHLFTVNHIVFSPDGRLLATASRDKTVKIWDSRNFELLKVIDTIRCGGHINSVNRLLWMPECLVSCSDDRTVSIWRISP